MYLFNNAPNTFDQRLYGRQPLSPKKQQQNNKNEKTNN